MPMNPECFTARLQVYFEGCQRISNEYLDKHFPTNPRESWRLDHGSRYVRIVHGNAVHSFVDKTNGDVLKAAGWKAPAKHARGNVHDENHGLKFIGPYGPAYLR